MSSSGQDQTSTPDDSSEESLMQFLDRVVPRAPLPLAEREGQMEAERG